MSIASITIKNSKYPRLLKEIPAPPKKLWYIGDLPDSQPAVAIVGSRKFSAYGRGVAHTLAFELAAAGITIVSGLAYGIDSFAHQATLEADGKTVAVLANGLDQIYPAANRGLARDLLLKKGVLISEFEVGTPPLRHHFPARNRIIAGLSLAVVVVEAPAESGALITANFALEANRLVMAVPGNVTSRYSEGSNLLLKAGALPVTNSRDVLAALELEVPALKAKLAKPASKDEAVILDLLAQDISDADILIKKSGFSASKFNQVIGLMEISGKVRALGGSKWISR